jgi:hypothetical protein
VSEVPPGGMRCYGVAKKTPVVIILNINVKKCMG